MAATKPALASGGITHCRLRWGLRRFFFRVLPIVLSLAFSTMFNSTTFSSSRRKVQRANPSGAGDQVRAINFASAAPSKIRGRAEFGLYLRVSAFDQSTPGAADIVYAGVQRRRDRAVAPTFAASDTSAFRRMRPFVSDCAGCLPAQIIASSCPRSSLLNFATFFLTEISLPRRVTSIAALPRQRFRKTPEIQRRWRIVSQIAGRAAAAAGSFSAGRRAWILTTRERESVRWTIRWWIAFLAPSRWGNLFDVGGRQGMSVIPTIRSGAAASVH